MHEVQKIRDMFYEAYVTKDIEELSQITDKAIDYIISISKHESPSSEQSDL
jgi:hypothetical protein